MAEEIKRNEAGEEINENGHTIWPKWVTDKNGNRVLVKNKKEEDEACGSAFSKIVDDVEKEEYKEDNKKEKKKKDW